MIQFENTTIIHRPIEPVFAYLAELENLPQWNYALSETHKITPGPIGEGTEYRQQRRLPRPPPDRDAHDHRARAAEPAPGASASTVPAGGAPISGTAGLGALRG